METLIEKFAVYGSLVLVSAIIVFLYVRKLARGTRNVRTRIEKARKEGTFEPVSLHPVVNPDNCIGTGACVLACPEKDILGILNGKATTINASRCIGHGACFHACPTRAITLCLGTEKRGVELPHVNKNFETNVQGIYIAGELGGMGLIRNAVEQGRQAVDHIASGLDRSHRTGFDLVIVGAGPAGISASLEAKKLGLRFTTMEQDTLGGTVFTYPRSKIVMTSPMNLPLHGRVKLFQTTKPELLQLWNQVLDASGIVIQENTRVESVEVSNEGFTVMTSSGESISARFVLLAIGRRGSPRKLDIPGESLEKVAYRLLEPEEIRNEKVLVVGGGDSAVESALMLAGQNQVTLSYRQDAFGRIKPGNQQRIVEAIRKNELEVLFNTRVDSIEKEQVTISDMNSSWTKQIGNDRVFIFAGGMLPSTFLENAGIRITSKFGDAILKHD